MAHDVPLGCAPDEYDDLISGTCSHLPKCGLIYGRDLVFLDKFNFGVSGLSGNLWLMEKWELKNIFNFLLKGKIMAVPAILFSLMKYGRRCALTKKNKGKGNK
ncbi:TPA: hypothetical protein ACO4FT_004913 [Escherichia coli]|uniref:hypothetical protein n=1 Tax=Escherichia coli TaxID=562 RepID=UPI00201A7944|nr:hypothetical protein [Escherichia coli]MDO2772354.1 hypothetical protein [Escherichia coli]